MSETVSERSAPGGFWSDLPPVTAIVPTHLRPELMRRAVQSVVDQSYGGRIEIIVVFDDCPLEVPEIVLSENRTLRGTSNVRSSGLAGARNTGILAASHDFVAFLDDDDAWLPEKLDAQMGVFAAHPDTVLVGSAMQVDDGSQLRERLVERDCVGYDDLILNRLAGLHSSSFVLRKGPLIGAVGMVDEELPGSYGEDYDLLLRAARIAPVRLVDRPLVTVCWQGQSYFFGRWALYAESLQYMLLKHPGFAGRRHGYGRISAQISFALAASAQRRAAWHWIGLSLRRDPIQLRPYLAAAILLHVLSAETIMRLAARRGKGI